MGAAAYPTLQGGLFIFPCVNSHGCVCVLCERTRLLVFCMEGEGAFICSSQFASIMKRCGFVSWSAPRAVMRISV